MATDKAPAFQFYPKDFMTDENVLLMSNTEIGVYIRLLCSCWLEGTLPLDTDSLARMAHMPLKQFTKFWENSPVKRCFRVGEDGRLHHKRLDEEREKQATHRQRQSDKGIKGAAKRWPNDSRSIAPAIAQALPIDSSPSPSPIPPVSPPLDAWTAEWFDRIYAIYPNKDRKVDANRAWVELRPTQALFVAIEADIRGRVQAGWKKYERRFIPQLRTYLAERMWEDAKGEAPPPWEDDPYARFTKAWTCTQCGEIHEGTAEQASRGLCPKVAEAR